LERQNLPFSLPNSLWEIASHTATLLEAIDRYFSSIRVSTGNRWANAETWGTDNHTYPSRNVEEEATLGKCTDVWGNRPTREPLLGNGNQSVWSTTNRQRLTFSRFARKNQPLPRWSKLLAPLPNSTNGALAAV
jgi:hypothetical protein